VDSAVILVENIFRNFQRNHEERQELLDRLGKGYWVLTQRKPWIGNARDGWTHRLRLILISALQVDKAVLFSALITVAGFVPLFTMQGVEGQIFGPMARTYGYALAGALIATFTVTPVIASFLLPARVKEVETIVVRTCTVCTIRPALCFVPSRSGRWNRVGDLFGNFFPDRSPSGQRIPSHLEEGNFWIRASMPSRFPGGWRAATRKMREILKRHPEVLTVVRSMAGRRRQRRFSVFECRVVCSLKSFDEWPELGQRELTEQIQAEFNNELPGVVFNFSQYIEDNIEEGISGVKGVNSVKSSAPILKS